MEKRSKLALVILFGLLLLGIGLYFLFSPYLEQRAAEQPPALPSGSNPQIPGPSGSNIPSQTASSTSIAPAQLSDAAKLGMLETRARNIVERMVSGTSQNGFLGFRDAMTDATEQGKNALRVAQTALVQAHPATGPAFGLSTQAISAKTRDAKFGAPTISVIVQAIQKEDAGNPTQPIKITGKRYVLIFSKQSDDVYLVDGFTVEEVAL